MTDSVYLRDRFDTEYERGYADGWNDDPKEPLADDTEINYLDGYADGVEKRQAEGVPS